MRYLVCGLVLLLVGCTTQPVTLTFQPLDKFTQDDLAAALADAQMHNDVAGVNCWATLLQVIQRAGNVSAPRIIGAASALQAKRDLLGQGGVSRLDDVKRAINVGCAALLVDEGVTFAKFGGPALGLPSLP